MQKFEDFVFWANRAPFCIACVSYGHFMHYYWAGFLSWPFICDSFAQHTMPRWYIWRLCITVSYIVTMLMVYVVIHKVRRVHHPARSYRSW